MNAVTMRTGDFEDREWAGMPKKNLEYFRRAQQRSASGEFGGGFESGRVNAISNITKSRAAIRARSFGRLRRASGDKMSMGSLEEGPIRRARLRDVRADAISTGSSSSARARWTELSHERRSARENSRARGTRRARPAGDAEGDASDIVRRAPSNAGFAANPAPAGRGGSPEHAGPSDDPQAELAARGARRSSEAPRIRFRSSRRVPPEHVGPSGDPHEETRRHAGGVDRSTRPEPGSGRVVGPQEHAGRSDDPHAEIRVRVGRE
eukprot:CAMPEP_0184712058 /NCGR_PEP_ID=MMETSP0314-20130426/2664_1 /TAXON_ID=38298 /ORGANISM="Rhodella maculata, Strain CCMP 736" /LENGTH=264 /DNA_ID=CAMNT_0027174397 /DNA_START=187 /DNA_END=984 /DNA_ORIENTATION=+